MSRLIMCDSCKKEVSPDDLFFMKLSRSSLHGKVGVVLVSLYLCRDCFTNVVHAANIPEIYLRGANGE